MQINKILKCLWGQFKNRSDNGLREGSANWTNS